VPKDKVAAKAKAGAPDARLVKHVARAVAGVTKTDWKALGREGQKAHVLTAKRVLRAQARYKAAPEGADD